MLTRAKFLRLSGLTAVALTAAPAAMAKPTDGIVRVKSAYSFHETIDRLKKDIAAKGAKIEVWNRKNKFGWTPLVIAEGVQRGNNIRTSVATADAIRKVTK